MASKGPRGLNLVFTGIDGIGKSTVATAVAGELRSRGHRVVTPSWRDYLRPDPDDPRARVLGPPLLATLGALYAGARGQDGAALLETAPDGGRSLVSGTGVPWVTDDQRGHGIASHSPDALLAAGLSMLSAQLLLNEVVVRPALAQGQMVVQDSYGAKAVLKSVLLAERALRAQDAGHRAPTELFRALIHACLRQPDLPGVGVLLTGDPRDAERRKRDDDDITLTEHFGLTDGPRSVDGSAAETGFTSFQALLQDELRTLCEDGPWTEITVTDGPRETSVQESVRAVLALVDQRPPVAETVTVSRPPATTSPRCRWSTTGGGLEPEHFAVVEEFLAERTDTDRIAAAVLTGSRAAGLGHHRSDLDLYLLFHEQADADACTYGSRPQGKAKVDVTPLSTRAVEAMGAQIAELDVSKLSRRKFGFDDLSRFNDHLRLAIGAVVTSDEAGDRALGSLDFDALRRVQMIVWGARLKSYLDDVEGMLDHGDEVTALAAAEDAVRCAAETALLAMGDMYPSIKFLHRRMARHGCFTTVLQDHGHQLFGLPLATSDSLKVRQLVDLRLRTAGHFNDWGLARGWERAVPELPAPRPLVEPNRGGGPYRAPGGLLTRWHDSLTLSLPDFGFFVTPEEAELWVLLDSRPLPRLVDAYARVRGTTATEAQTFVRARVADWQSKGLVRGTLEEGG